MTLRPALAALAVAACQGSAQPPDLPGLPDGIGPPALGRTSVLWIEVCSLRADRVGIYGNRWPITPNLDALAQRGVRFEHVVPAGAWTRPSVASLRTGLYPRSVDIDRPRAEGESLKVNEAFVLGSEWLHDRGYRTIGISANPNGNRYFGFDQGFDVFVDSGRLYTGWFEHRDDIDDVTTRLLAEVEARDEGQPFLAQLLIADAHHPYPRSAMLLPTDMPWMPADQNLYDRQVRKVDAGIARLLRELEARGVDDLLVVITSDHGEGFTDDHAPWHGAEMYNAQTWVPWIMTHPGLPGGVVVPALAQTIDVLPTVLGLLEVDVGDYRFDGLDLHGAWTAAGPVPSRPFAVIQTAYDETLRTGLVDPTWRFLVQGEGADAPRELYRWAADPLERENLVQTEPRVAADFEAALAAWRETHPPRASGYLDEATVDEGTWKALQELGYLERN